MNPFSDTPDLPLLQTISTQSDLEQTWRRLMDPLGFGGLGLWMMVVDAEGRPIPHVIKVDERAHRPTEDDLASFGRFAHQLLEDLCPDGRWALLLSRPGSATVTAWDRAWATGLVTACRTVGVATEVVHLATDVDVVPLPLDALGVIGGSAGPTSDSAA